MEKELTLPISLPRDRGGRQIYKQMNHVFWKKAKSDSRFNVLSLLYLQLFVSHCRSDLFIGSEVFIRVSSNQPHQPCQQTGSNPFQQCAHFLLHHVCYGFPIRTILVLYIHDGDSPKGYEIELTGMKNE